MAMRPMGPKEDGMLPCGRHSGDATYTRDVWLVVLCFEALARGY
jgi:hypothetical protein